MLDGSALWERRLAPGREMLAVPSMACTFTCTNTDESIGGAEAMR